MGSSPPLFLRNLWFNGSIFPSVGAREWSREQMNGPVRGYEGLQESQRVEWEALISILFFSHETCSLPHLTSVDLTMVF